MSDLYDHEIEEAVLSTFSNASITDLNKTRVVLEQSKLSKEDFHLPANQALFGAIESLLTKGLPIDPLAVKTELKSAEGLVSAGGWERVSMILMSPIHTETPKIIPYSKTLQELAVRRRIILEIHEAKAKLMNRQISPYSVLSNLTGTLAGVSVHTGDIRTLRDHTTEVVDHLDKVQEGKVRPILPTGIKHLDRVIGGLQPTLILVGALPGVGKSALIATISQNLAKNGDKVGVVSLEDDATWLAWRLLSQEADVDQFVLRWKKLDPNAKQKAGKGFEKMYTYADNILVADGSESGMSIDAVIQTANDMIVNHGAKCIIVDHLGEISGGGDEARYDMEVSRNLSRLRGIANRHGVPVVVAAHFRRRDGLEAGDKPKLSDFANSSGAERKARIALGLSREPDSETMTIHILKNTNGRAGFDVEVKFQGAAAMIRSVEGDYR